MCGMPCDVRPDRRVEAAAGRVERLGPRSRRRRPLSSAAARPTRPGPRAAAHARGDTERTKTRRLPLPMPPPVDRRVTVGRASRIPAGAERLFSPRTGRSGGPAHRQRVHPVEAGDRVVDRLAVELERRASAARGRRGPPAARRARGSAPRQKCGPAPNVSDFAAPRSAVMSKLLRVLVALGLAVRVPRARRSRRCPSGKVTSRNSTSSSITRAVNGATGSKRSTSSAACGASDGSRASSCPLVGVVGEQPHAVRELALRGVDAAVQHVAHERHALLVGQAVALLLGGDQRGDEVVAGARAALLDQLAARTRRTPSAACSSSSRRVISAIASNWLLEQVRQPVQLGRVLERRAHHRRDHAAPGRAWRSRSRSRTRPRSATCSHSCARNSRIAGR